MSTSELLAQASEEQRRAGNAARAQELAEAALARDDASSEVGWALAWRCLGTLAWSQGKLALAHDQYRKALEHRRRQQPPSRPGLIVALDDLALACYFLDLDDEAQALRLEALQLAESDAATDAAVLRRLRRRLAQSYQAAGLVAEAETLYLACRPDPSDTTDDQIGWLNAMALLSEDKGELAAGADWFEQLLDVLEGTQAAEGLAQALGNALKTRFELGQDRKAAKLLRRLRQICRQDPKLSSRLALIDVRIELLSSRGRYAAAAGVAGLGERVIEAANPGRRPPSQRIALRALLLRLAGRNGEAQALIERHLPRDEDIALDAAALLVELSFHRLESGDAASAKALLARVLEVEIGQASEGQKWRILAGLGDAAQALGRARAAALLGKLALANLRASALGLSGGQLEGWLRPRMEVYDRVLNRLTMAGRVPEAMALQLRRSQEVSRELGSRRGSFDRTIDDVPFRPGEEDLRSRYRALQRMMRPILVDGVVSGPREDGVAMLRRWLEDVWQERFDLAEPRGRPPAEAPGRQVSQRRPLLTFLPQADRFRAVLVLDGEELSFALPAKAESVAREIRTLRMSLQDRTDAWLAPARALHEALIAPVEAAWADQPRLDIMTAGMMGFLPFSALHDGNAFLIEKTAIAFRTGQSPPDPRSGLSAQWAGAAFATAGQGRLPGAVAEVQRLAAHGDVEAFIDRDFTSAALRAALARRFNLLHIATHFNYVPGRPHHSTLLLGDGEELRLSELAGAAFDCSHIDLVVLSACDTGISDALDLGLDGLAGLLQAKGVRDVVATLWRVDDGCTETLMSHFYRALLAAPRTDPVMALALAQRGMLRGEPGRAAEPPMPRGGIGGASVCDAATAMAPGSWAGFVAFAAES